MERELNARQAREGFSTLLDQVQYQGDTYIINRNGKPAAAVVPLKVYETWRRQREAFFVRVQEMAQRADLEPDEAMTLALEAQQAVRAEKQTSEA